MKLKCKGKVVKEEDRAKALTLNNGKVKTISVTIEYGHREKEREINSGESQSP